MLTAESPFCASGTLNYCAFFKRVDKNQIFINLFGLFTFAFKTIWSLEVTE